MRPLFTVLLMVCGVALLTSCATPHMTHDSTITVVSLAGQDFAARVLDSPHKKFDMSDWRLDDYVESAFVHALEAKTYRVSRSAPTSRDLLKEHFGASKNRFPSARARSWTDMPLTDAQWSTKALPDIRAVAQGARADYVVVVGKCHVTGSGTVVLVIRYLACGLWVVDGTTGDILSDSDPHRGVGIAAALPWLPIEEIDPPNSAAAKKQIEDTRNIIFALIDDMARGFAHGVVVIESGCHFWCEGSAEERVQKGKGVQP